MKHFVFVGLICLIPTALFSNDYPLDTNKDGKYDKWYTYSGGMVQTEKMDENFDGIVDHIVHFDAAGKVLTEELDFNFDGVMDNFYEYVDGRMAIQKIDSNYDGKIDIWLYIKKGSLLEKIEQDTDFDGKIDRTKVFGK